MDGQTSSDKGDAAATADGMRPSDEVHPLTGALDALGAAVVVYDRCDRLVFANRGFKAMFPRLVDVFRPGASFPEMAEAVVRSGYFAGSAEEMIAAHARRRANGQGTAEVPLTDGRWLLLDDQPTADGGRVISYTDITASRRREERLDLALRASNDGLWDWDAQTGDIYLSPRWKEMLGYAADEALDVRGIWRDMVHPDDVERVARTIFGAIDSAQGLSLEFRMRHRDGTWRHIKARLHVAPGPEGRAARVVGLNADITELRAAQDREARTAARLAEAEQVAQVGSWERDAAGTEHWSPALRDLLGVAADAPASRAALLDRVHPDDRATADALLDDGRCCFRIRRRDGTERTVLSSAKPIRDAEGAVRRVVGAWRDVTMLRQVEDRAARAEVHLLGAIETVGDGILLLDPEKRIVMLNSQYADDFPSLQDHLVPGAPFEAFLLALREQGLVRRFDGRLNDEDWLGTRLRDLGTRTRPFELELADGRSFLVKETRTVDDYILIVRTDITELKQREQALQESRARLRAIFDNSVQFIGRLSPDGTLLEVNQTAIRFAGCEPEALLGRPFWDTPWWTHDPVEQRRLKQALDEARRGERVRFEATHRASDGILHTVDVSITPILDDDGRVLMLIPEGRDITAQRQAEEALRRNTRFVQALADTAQMPIYAHDREGRYVFCNDAFALAVAHAPDAVIGKSLFSVSLRERGIDTHAVNRDLLDAGGSISYEARVTLGDGTLRDMIVTKSTYNAPDGTTEGIVAVLADITRQKQAERRFTDFALSSADWFWEMDRRGRFTFVSDRIAETTSIRPSDVIGRQRDDFMDPDWSPDAILAYRAALEARRPMRGFVYRTVPVRGRVHYIRITFVPAHDAEGNFIGFRGTGSEVTPETEAKAALEAAKEAAEAASRTKTEFLAAMSHELRTPLNAIIGFSDVMQMQALGPLGNDTYLGYARDIRSSGEHLLNMVNDVLDASRLEAGRLDLHEAPVDLAGLAAAAHILVQQRAEAAGVALSVEVAPDLPPFRGDEGRLKKVLTGLLANAVKFTPDGGSARLRLHRDAAGDLRVDVEDTGIGMSDEDVERALQRFTQLDARLSRKYEGMGLGLTLARDIAELHGGRLEIQGTPGRGTTVVVVLPGERFMAPA